MQAELLDLSKYRMEKAKECLADAISAFKENRLSNSINRSYYAMFHAIRALLIINALDSKKHATIIGYFNQHYIANNEIEKHYYQMIANAFRIRNKTDYDDFYVVGKDEAHSQLKNAQEFVNFMAQYIDGIGS